MRISQALRVCRRVPDELHAARARLQHFEASLENAVEEWAAIEALAAIRGEQARIQRMEQALQQARIRSLEAIALLPIIESEIAAAFYLGRMSVTQIALARRCNERYVKRCKARAVAKMTNGQTIAKGGGGNG